MSFAAETDRCSEYCFNSSHEMYIFGLFVPGADGQVYTRKLELECYQNPERYFVYLIIER